MSWHVVQTRPHKEATVEEALRECEVSVYLPKETRIRRRTSGRIQTREEIKLPLFPRYLFVRVQSEAGEHIVRSTDGVVDFLRCPMGGPWVLPERDLMRIRVAEAAGDYDFTPKKVTFSTGQPVQIRRGPFTGWKAKFLSKRADERVEVLMQSLVRGGREYPATLHIDDLERIDAPC